MAATERFNGGRTSRLLRAFAALVLAFGVCFATTGTAAAQDLDAITRQLDADGWYIEPGAEGESDKFAQLMRSVESLDDTWYFVSMADYVDDFFAEDLADRVRTPGNVLVYFLEEDQGEVFVSAQLSSPYSQADDDFALDAFDSDWDTPDEFMIEVAERLDQRAAAATAGAGTDVVGSGSADASNPATTDTGGSGVSLAWLAVPVVAVGGGMWFASSRGKNRKQAEQLETAQKIRAEIQTELDELANDVLVLSSPVDLGDNAQAVQYYREATATYTEISDELPDVADLADAELPELSALGARIAHARWEMDAAEALLNGEELPEKPKVAPPPQPQRPPQEQQRRMESRPLPRREPRPRVPYSPSRRRSGGGLLDILIAGAGMLGQSRGYGRSSGGMFGGSRGGSRRSSGGMFGGSSRSGGFGSSGRTRQGGGVFGGGSTSTRRSGSTRRSSTQRRSSPQRRTRARSSSSRRSSSRRSSSSSRRPSSRRRRR